MTAELSKDECSYCRLPFEIVRVKFGLAGLSFVETCPNCGLVRTSFAAKRRLRADEPPPDGEYWPRTRRQLAFRSR